LILHHPKLFPQPKKITGMIQHIDLVPTVRDYLGIEPDNSAFDGVSTKPLIEGKADSLRDFAFFEESYVQRKIGWRQKRHKYINAPDGIGMCSYCQRVHAGVEELYDLEEDPEEKNNLVAQKRLKADQMKGEMENFLNMLKTKRKKIMENQTASGPEGEELQDVSDQKKIKKKLRSLGYMD
jgi:arylsulfatase A-like enzyme